MGQHQIRVVAKHLSLIASLVLALGPMASAARCCCLGTQVLQVSKVDRCCGNGLADGSASAMAVPSHQTERSCCQIPVVKGPVADMPQGALACESSVVDKRACLCEQACQTGEASAVRTLSKLKDSVRTTAEFAIPIGLLAPPLGGVPSRNGSERSISFLSAQDRCVLLCRWLN